MNEKQFTKEFRMALLQTNFSYIARVINQVSSDKERNKILNDLIKEAEIHKDEELITYLKFLKVVY